MMNRTHGGDWAGYEQKYHRQPLDFSANVSPLGPPAGVKAALIRAMDQVARYPDPQCRQLRESLGAYHGVAPGQILCGNGASDLIDRLALALRPKRALVTAPAFSEYAAALCRVGCRVTEYPLQKEESFQVTEGILPWITPALDVLFLCEPSNPAGQITDRGLLDKILEKCDACRVLLVADECFEDFLTDRSHSLVPVLSQHRLLILRAFTKFYGLAGVRLGYCLCQDPPLLEAMSRAGQPWPVSNLAQAAGVAALGEREYGERLRGLIQTQRAFLQEALKNLGCYVVPGQANYLLFFAQDVHLAQKLEAQGVLIRSCANDSGLGPGWYRIAVRGEEENRRLLQAMRRCIP